MSTAKQFINDNVLCRCGQAVSLLAQAGLLKWPGDVSSESEVNQWWMVTDALADRLKRCSQPVIRFGELNMWGRSSTSASLEDDADLLRAVVA